MADDETSDEHEPAKSLSADEAEAVEEKGAESPRVLHEIVRVQGEEELRRPALSLILSALAAGFAITASLLAEAALHAKLPGTPAFELLTDLGYSAGFVVVILGNLQLFTETTITAVLPVAAKPSAKGVWWLLRLWGIVFAGNMIGTLIVAIMVAHTAMLTPELREAAITVSTSLLGHGPDETLLMAIPAGFLLAAIAWTLPNARGSEFWVVLGVTYVIAIGGFSHVVVGSSEAWLLWQAGRAPLGWAVGGYLLPTLAGNIIGGTGLFALLAHGQVRTEL